MNSVMFYAKWSWQIQISNRSDQNFSSRHIQDMSEFIVTAIHFHSFVMTSQASKMWTLNSMNFHNFPGSVRPWIWLKVVSKDLKELGTCKADTLDRMRRNSWSVRVLLEGCCDRVHWRIEVWYCSPRHNWKSAAKMLRVCVRTKQPASLITRRKGATVYHREQCMLLLRDNNTTRRQQRIKAESATQGKHHRLLRNVTVLVARTGSPLYVLFVNQRLYALLYQWDARSEPRLWLTQHLSRHKHQPPLLIH